MQQWILSSHISYLYKPGSAMITIYNNDWKQTGAKLTTFRMGGTMTSGLGRYLMAQEVTEEKEI